MTPPRISNQSGEESQGARGTSRSEQRVKAQRSSWERERNGADASHHGHGDETPVGDGKPCGEISPVETAGNPAHGRDAPLTINPDPARGSRRVGQCPSDSSPVGKKSGIPRFGELPHRGSPLIGGWGHRRTCEGVT